MAESFNAVKDNQWREYLNPLRGLTMELICQLVEQGERGAYADLQWFYQCMERSDALIATVVQRRRAALLGCPWDVVADDKPSDPVLAREQAVFLHEAYGRIENLREAVAFLATASFRGYAHAEKHYDGQGRVVRLEPVEQWFWCRKGMFGDWQYNQHSRSCVQEGVPVDLGNFVYTESVMALDRILSVQYFRRNLCMTDWDGYLSIYGIPSVFIVGPPGCTDPAKETEYMNIAQSLLKDGRGYLPYGSTVSYVNGGGVGRPPFLDHLAYIDKQIVLVGTGGILTMFAESGSGTLAGGAHSDAWKQICAGDAVVVSESCRRDLDKPLLAEAFPGWPVLAGFKLITEDANPYAALLAAGAPAAPSDPSAYAAAQAAQAAPALSAPTADPLLLAAPPATPGPGN